VRQLLECVDSHELTEWMAYDLIDPFGEARADYRSAIVAAQVTNHSFSPPRTSALPSDFCPRFERDPDASDGPILLDDPQAQSDLIDERLYARFFDAAKGK